MRPPLPTLPPRARDAGESPRRCCAFRPDVKLSLQNSGVHPRATHPALPADRRALPSRRRGGWCTGGWAESRKACGKAAPIVSVLRTCTTWPVVGSMSADASRTPIPEMLLIFRNRPAEALANICWWNSRTWAAPAGLRARAFSAAVKEACNAIMIVSSFMNTATHLRPRIVRRFSNAQAARAILWPMVAWGLCMWFTPLHFAGYCWVDCLSTFP
jgi:hypothetical protein